MLNSRRATPQHHLVDKAKRRGRRASPHHQPDRAASRGHRSTAPPRRPNPSATERKGRAVGALDSRSNWTEMESSRRRIFDGRRRRPEQPEPARIKRRRRWRSQYRRSAGVRRGDEIEGDRPRRTGPGSSW